MAHVISHKTKSSTYYELVERYRDSTGKRKVRHLKYLGKDPRPYLEEVVKT
jgi:hypothetical protein